MDSIYQYALFIYYLAKDALVYGSLIGTVIYFIIHSRGVQMEFLETVLSIIGVLFCLLVLQFLLHSKNELYDMLSRSNNYEGDDDDE